MTQYYLAQLNIATLLEPLDSPRLADFVANLDRINTLAESSDGYIWRLKGDGNDATSFRPFGEEVIVNMSVWRDIESLQHFVYKTAHVEIMRRRREWFEKMATAFTVLWWIPANQIPTIEEANERLKHLQQLGPSEYAFTFAKPVSKPY